MIYVCCVGPECEGQYGLRAVQSSSPPDDIYLVFKTRFTGCACAAGRAACAVRYCGNFLLLEYVCNYFVEKFILRCMDGFIFMKKCRDSVHFEEPRGSLVENLMKFVISNSVVRYTNIIPAFFFCNLLVKTLFFLAVHLCCLCSLDA